MHPIVAVALFVLTAFAELAGCYLAFVWMHGARSPLLLVASTVALGVFAWLLSLHPSAARAYAAYGGVYVTSAMGWGWLIEQRAPDRWDLTGAALCLLGTAVIVLGPHR